MPQDKNKKHCQQICEYFSESKVPYFIVCFHLKRMPLPRLTVALRAYSKVTAESSRDGVSEDDIGLKDKQRLRADRQAGLGLTWARLSIEVTLKQCGFVIHLVVFKITLQHPYQLQGFNTNL